VSAALVVDAQQPRIENGRITTQPGGPAFGQSIRQLVAAQGDVTWVGYSVPMVQRERSLACYDSGNTWTEGRMVRSHGPAVARLEPSTSRSTSDGTRTVQGQTGPVKLDGSGRMAVLLRVAERRVERIRVFPDDCQLDAGGRPVVWFESVAPADSIAYLEALASTETEHERRVTDSAVTAIALHDGQAADASLERLVAPGQPERVRRAVPFWLGNSRGRRGLDVLRRLVKEDASAEVRKKAVFGISQSDEAGAIDTLIDAARGNDRSAVRGEAIFWLAQRAGRKAAEAITERIEQDPDTDVKKRAVFALSQLPKEEGVPLLIRVARTHSNPVVRKQAMFWLGQSKDARAIDFFAEILK
jgi:hypothetical protein